MKIIDFHTHVFPDELAQRAIAKLKECAPELNNATDGTATGLLASMNKSNICKSVILPIATKVSQVIEINSCSAKSRSKKFEYFGSIHPDFANIEQEVTRMCSLGIKGIKLHPEYQDFHVDDRKIFPLYEALAANKIIAHFHAGKDPGPFACDHALPHAMRKVVKQFPLLRIIASHMGGWNVWNEVEKELVGLPLYFDTSAVQGHLEKERFLRLVRKHGVEKILFGTDSPWYDQTKSIEWIDCLPLTDGEKEMVFYRNALSLLIC